MKRILLLVLPIVLLVGSIGSRAQAGVSDCTAVEAAYFEEYLYPVFKDYTALREAFVAEGDIGQAGGELVALRAQLTTLGDMQTGILFRVLSLEMDDPALDERLRQMGPYYGTQSDEQYLVAAEAIAEWTAKRLTIEGDPEADHA